MLGLLYQREEDTDFVPTSSFRPPHADLHDWSVLDARHGRMLVLDVRSFSRTMEMELVVWDPVSLSPWPRPSAPRRRSELADGVGAIFIRKDDGLFTVHLKSGRVEKIGEFVSNFGVVPYMNFCTPDGLNLALGAGPGRSPATVQEKNVTI
ncbi:hypothetical protein BAE44_0014405 [Dichanthelium oligosanthes]|uniref:Uncharacterized protein n=1 Tax=Dichanthelium oligosanthes TaxID=888268 RepID=A0A1E5VHM1_9POAL|nr:hypothetical protein BAE44_0014405 [Dichanthelium oligosanthes]